MILLKARWIVPVASEPIENGWLRIENGIIEEVGHHPIGATHASPVEDLGNAALFPGLINCHAHLEFDRSNHPNDSFASWADSVQASQQEAGSIEGVWQRNVQRLLETGTTTVVNHGNQQILRRGAPQNDNHFLPHIIQVCEFVGAAAENGARSYRDACKQRLALLQSGLVEDAVVSPHSVYAVSPVVWEEFIRHRRGVIYHAQKTAGAINGAPTDLISIHLKESADEEQLFTSGKGPLARLVKERGGLLWQHDPVGWLKEKQLLRPQTLLIHGNYLSEADLAHLQGTGTSVIHCPGSHAYFGHRAFPFKALQDHKVRIALGTDSLASNEDISMLQEMQLLRRGGPAWPPVDGADCGHPHGGAPTSEQLIQMATINGAEAVGIAGTRGSLEANKWADIIAVKLGSVADPYEALWNAERVNMTMIRGRIVHRDGL